MNSIDLIEERKKGLEAYCKALEQAVNFLELELIAIAGTKTMAELKRIAVEANRLNVQNQALQKEILQLKRMVYAVNASDGLILSSSLSAAILILKERIRFFEDDVFSAKPADLTEVEIEVMAAAFIEVVAKHINGDMLNHLLCQVRYQGLIS